MAANTAPQSPKTRWHDGGPLRIGVSACLVGQPVRFDGGHKRDPFLCDALAPHVEWVPVCPEVEYGLPVPRETLRLERLEHAGESPALIETRARKNHSAGMRRFAAQRVSALQSEELAAFVFKSRSPSCGLEAVPVWPKRGQPQESGRGLFAEVLTATFPHLPVEDEARLQDPEIREAFVERIFAAGRLRNLMGGGWRVGDLVAFHSAHQLQLMAHSPLRYRALEALVAGAKDTARGELRREYEAGFFAALATRATRSRQTRVLNHIEGILRDHLDSGDRAELHARIEDNRLVRVPVVVPITLLRDHVRHCADRLGVATLSGQVYLERHPGELLLRNPM